MPTRELWASTIKTKLALLFLLQKFGENMYIEITHSLT